MCGRVHELQTAIRVLVMPQCLPTALPGGQTSSHRLSLLTGKEPLNSQHTQLWDAFPGAKEDSKISLPYWNIHTSLCAHNLSLSSGAYLELQSPG